MITRHTQPVVKQSRHNRDVAKIVFGDSSSPAKRAAAILLSPDFGKDETGSVVERPYTYDGAHPGMSKSTVFALMREAGVSIEPCLPQIQAEAEQAAHEAEVAEAKSLL